MKILLFVAFLTAILVALRLMTRPAPVGPRRQPARQEMSREEALAILGLEQGHADTQSIIEAHRRLMQKVHPDKGGSAHLARQLNEAKRVPLQND